MFGSMGSSGVSVDTLDQAIRILSVVSDPQAAAQALAELRAVLEETKVRQADAIAKESSNIAEVAQLVQTQQAQDQRNSDLDTREVALATRQAQLDIASTAVGERESRVGMREVAASEAEAKAGADSAGGHRSPRQRYQSGRERSDLFPTMSHEAETGEAE